MSPASGNAASTTRRRIRLGIVEHALNREPDEIARLRIRRYLTVENLDGPLEPLRRLEVRDEVGQRRQRGGEPGNRELRASLSELGEPHAVGQAPADRVEHVNRRRLSAPQLLDERD